MACKALTAVMQPKIDEMLNNKSIHIFQNMVKDGISIELAQKYAELSDEFAEKALAEL